MPVIVLRIGTALAAWVVLGTALAVLAVCAWAGPAGVQGVIAAVQAWYGVPSPVPIWLRADAHAHMLVSGLATLWFGLGCRLFAPRAIPWLPLGLVVSVALFDELFQLGSTTRSFEWSDQLGDACGIIAALPLLLWIRHWQLRAGADQKAAKASSATCNRS
jgi:hypothetical protein